ncbi:MAG: 50S ribosomal protein L9 [Armatimonadetes bacterium]|nr:50S ribosomal protein L9 [Armatimonadota bacterium]
MKLILTRDVQDLGKAGDLVNVAEGYGRNFLLPRKLAIVADAGAIKALERKKKILEIKGEQLLAEAQQIAERLNNLQVVIKEKAGSGTKLYGSVTSQEIADALLEQHSIKVDKRKIHITEPIKNIGTFEVPVKLHHDVSATIHVEVVPTES